MNVEPLIIPVKERPEGSRGVSLRLKVSEWAAVDAVVAELGTIRPEEKHSRNSVLQNFVRFGLKSWAESQHGPVVKARKPRAAAKKSRRK